MRPANDLSKSSRRKAFRSIAAGAAVLASGTLVAHAQLGASNRVSARARQNIRRRHSIVAFTRATARQRAIAAENARKAQEALRKEWARKNRAKAKVTPPAQVPMTTVVKDLGEPRVQAVKTAPSAGAKDAVVAVDVTTGNLVSGTVVNTEKKVTPRTDISEQVRVAAADPEVPGNPPAEFVNGNVTLAAI